MTDTSKGREFYTNDYELDKIKDQDLNEWQEILVSLYPAKSHGGIKFIEHSSFLSVQNELKAVREENAEIKALIDAKDAKLISLESYRIKELEIECAGLNNRINLLAEENGRLREALESMPSAMYHALLETTAWMGIPEKKRENHIAENVSNIKYIVNEALKKVGV